MGGTGTPLRCVSVCMPDISAADRDTDFLPDEVDLKIGKQETLLMSEATPKVK